MFLGLGTGCELMKNCPGKFEKDSQRWEDVALRTDRLTASSGRKQRGKGESTGKAIRAGEEDRRREERKRGEGVERFLERTER